VRLVRLFTGTDGQTHVEDGEVAMAPLGRDAASPWSEVEQLRFQETPAGASLDWHTAPHRQYVVTLSGTLEFETRGGERVRVGPGDVLLAEDTTGGGHRWRLVDDQPWRRVYAQLPADDATT
jgi:quercetin dioxygenase-like cupin family protein